MKKLQKYVLKEVLKAFVPALLVFVLVVSLGFCVQLLHDGLDVVRLAGLPQYLLSLSVPLVLPSAFLVAVIIGFGRLAADNELTAIRVGGVSLFHVLLPVGALSVLLSVVAIYLHFETVPRARVNIELLKYEAIKQVLIDKVALSSQRQFTFAPFHIQYQEFRDGRMRNVLILETQAGVPKAIITASAGTIELDPTRREFIRVRLSDCAVTRLRADEAGGPVTFQAGEATLPVRAAPELGDVGSRLKHLGLPELLVQWAELSAAVSSHEEHYKDPNTVGHDAAREIKALHAKLAEHDQALDQHNKDLMKLTQEDRPKYQRTIELKEEEIAAAQTQKELLEKQQVAYTDEIKKIEDQTGVARPNFDRIVELQKLLASVKERMEGLNVKMEEAQAEIKSANSNLREGKTERRELEIKVAKVAADQAQVQSQIRRHNEIRSRALLQDDLRSLNIRIHKRLSQALAVFVFAMVGMPLGIMTRRRSIMVAVGISFAIVLFLFYPFLIVGQIAADNGVLPTPLAMWSGNGVTLLIGLGLTISVLRK